MRNPKFGYPKKFSFKRVGKAGKQCCNEAFSKKVAISSKLLKNYELNQCTHHLLRSQL